jgi:protein-tyrosine phosphatase
MFREVVLPKGVRGKLLLHSMPGRWETLRSAWAEANREHVTVIARLTGLAEVRSASPEYAEALANGQVPFEVLPCEMPDFGVPDDRGTYWAVARDVARRLQAGEAVLVHCGAGIGRTGTFAASVLVALGEPVRSAEKTVARAGSGAETDDQRELVAWCASQLRVEP